MNKSKRENHNFNQPIDIISLIQYFSKINLITKIFVICIPIIFLILSLFIYNQYSIYERQVTIIVKKINPNDFNFNKTLIKNINPKGTDFDYLNNLLDGFYKEIINSNLDDYKLNIFFNRIKKDRNLKTITFEKFKSSLNIKQEGDYRFDIFFKYDENLDGIKIMEEFLKFNLDYSSNTLFRNLELSLLNNLNKLKRSRDFKNSNLQFLSKEIEILSDKNQNDAKILDNKTLYFDLKNLILEEVQFYNIRNFVDLKREISNIDFLINEYERSIQEIKNYSKFSDIYNSNYLSKNAKFYSEKIGYTKAQFVLMFVAIGFIFSNIIFFFVYFNRKQ